MARTSSAPLPRTRRPIIPPALTLAGWRLGHTWRLLLTAGLGMLAAVMLVAAVPLFSQVAISAGLRGALASDPAGTGMGVSAFVNTLSPDTRQGVQDHLFPIVGRDLNGYLVGSPTFSVQTSRLPLATVAHHGANTDDVLSLVGLDSTEVSSHVTMAAGRLPTAQSAGLEVALESASAQLLRVGVGDSFTFVAPKGTPAAKALTVQIVGIFTQQNRRDPYWSERDFAPNPASGPSGTGTAYAAIAAVDPVMAHADQIQAITPANQQNTSTYLWHYNLDFSRLSGNNLGDLINAFNSVQIEAQNTLSNVSGVQYVSFTTNYGALLDFQNRVFALQVPITLLLLQVLALVIFFVSLMADIVVDRQTEAIAVLRSRGASRRQVFGALATQTAGLALLAGIVGPPIAILGVRLVAARSLSTPDQNALNVLSDPVATLWGIRYFILAAVVGACVAMLISINRAMGLDVLALRRESARTTRRPLWQRLNLDIVFGIVGITGYMSYVVGVSRLSPHAQSLLSPLSLVAPFFLLIAAALLFLRFFPLALNGAAWLAGRGRRAEPMLALAQMARSPRQSLRTTLLLALTTAFTIFTLVFVASQNQHTLDAAAFTVGADFSGTLPSATAASSPTPAAQEAQYAALPGVTSATVGYTAPISAQSNAASIQITLNALNADTYAQTAVWTASNSTQPIGELMALLRDNRATATGQDVVPVIVDEATWRAFHLSQDPHFTLSVPGYNSTSLHLIAIEHIAHIAGIYDVPGYYDNAGVLADFASYAAVFEHDTSTKPQQNSVWLRTSDDGAALSQLRVTLNDVNSPLHLTELLDRRSIITNAARDPLVIDLLGVLAICTVTAGALGILGGLVAAWLSARSRLTNFAVLRAMGSDPGQTARVLVWEQSIITATALGLGLILGLILAGAILPTLIFTNLLARSNFSLGAINVPPIQTIIPFGAVGLVVGGVAVIFLIVLALMTRIVARPSISQTLRLNED